MGINFFRGGDDGQLHAIAYGGQALSSSQRNWTVAQLELYGFMISLRAYECFAIHKEVTVITDNSNVLRLDKWLPVNARERRMITYLMQFRLKVKYLHGCHNASADCLSRSFTDMPPEDQKEFLPDLNDKDDFIVSVTDVVGTEATVLNEDTEETVEKGDWVDYAVTADSESRIENLEDTEDMMGSQDVSLTMSQALGADPVTVGSVTQGSTDDKEVLDTETEEVTWDYLPEIEAEAYKEDEEFKYLYAHLQNQDFQGSEKEYRQLLLIADLYFIKDGLLYKIAIPRNKRVNRVYPVTERLCVPKKFRYALVKYYHERFGHFAIERLFLTLFSIIYWKNMYMDITDFCQTCDTCLQAKRDYNHKTRPLNPLQVAESPFHTWAIDHQDLCRKTTEGSVAILCCVDSFSGWPILAPVPSLDAETTARVFFKEVVSRFGIPTQVSSDRGSAFMSTFFTTLMKLLNIKHRISAAKAPRSNGLAEALVKRLSDLIKIYVKNDSEIEHYLPLIEMSLRATAHTQLKLSPFQIIHGCRMNVGNR